MSANIYVHELRARFRSVIVWSVAVAAIVFLFSSLFPGFASQAAALKQMFARFPPALLEAFGMQNTDMSTVLGFYGFLFVFVQLCLAIQASNYGFGLVSIE
jgi:ABC-2 type transport system permease protein